jgi:hypothetical protein
MKQGLTLNTKQFFSYLLQLKLHAKDMKKELPIQKHEAILIHQNSSRLQKSLPYLPVL